MMDRYLETYFTPAVLAAQRHYNGAAAELIPQASVDPLGEAEQQFIEQRDSFYMATVSSDGWPYVQHRGGPMGFLKILDEHTLGFADLHGNQQLISAGNLSVNDRVALFLMDYPARTRLKIMGHVRVLDARENPDLGDRLAPSADLRAKVERIMLIDVVGFNWNCSKYITPRVTAEQVRTLVVAPLQAKIAELERELAATRAKKS